MTLALRNWLLHMHFTQAFNFVFLFPIIYANTFTLLTNGNVCIPFPHCFSYYIYNFHKQSFFHLILHIFGYYIYTYTSGQCCLPCLLDHCVYIQFVPEAFCFLYVAFLLFRFRSYALDSNLCFVLLIERRMLVRYKQTLFFRY